MDNKKICIPIGGYFPSPNSGGPAVSVENFCELLGEEYSCYIITNTKKGKKEAEKEGLLERWNVRGKAKVYYFQQNHMKWHYIKDVMEDIEPDVLYLQSLFNAKFTIPCLVCAKKMGIPVILAPRGELHPEALDKKYKKVPYLICLKIFGLIRNTYYQATSVAEKNFICQKLRANDHRVKLVKNIPTFKVNRIQRKKEKGILKLAYIARISEHKNLDMALRCLGKVKGNVEYHIYGVIEDEGYWEICRREIQRLPSNIKVEYHGGFLHDEITDIFQTVHGMFLPTRHENFGHAIVEAMFNSCPVIISNQTPWVDLNEKKVGWVCELHHEEEFVAAVQELVQLEQWEYDKIVGRLQEYVQTLFNVEDIKMEYKMLINYVLNGRIK